MLSKFAALTCVLVAAAMAGNLGNAVAGQQLEDSAPDDQKIMGPQGSEYYDCALLTQ